MGEAGRPSAEGLQGVAAMNARVYAMSEEDRERWYAEHPVSDYEAALRWLGDLEGEQGE